MKGKFQHIHIIAVCCAYSVTIIYNIHSYVYSVTIIHNIWYPCNWHPVLIMCKSHAQDLSHNSFCFKQYLRQPSPKKISCTVLSSSVIFYCPSDLLGRKAQPPVLFPLVNNCSLAPAQSDFFLCIYNFFKHLVIGKSQAPRHIFIFLRCFHI